MVRKKKKRENPKGTDRKKGRWGLGKQGRKRGGNGKGASTYITGSKEEKQKKGVNLDKGQNLFGKHMGEKHQEGKEVGPKTDHPFNERVGKKDGAQSLIRGGKNS